MAPPLASGTQLDYFTGIAPLLALPAAALFPQVHCPLQVMEEQDRVLTDDALQTERMIAIAILQPGWELRDSRDDRPLEPVVCLAQIDADHDSGDGRRVLLMRGLIRARITQELPCERPYRRVKLQLLPDVYPTPPAIDRDRRRLELLDLYRQVHPVVDADAQLQPAASGALSLGELCDQLSAAATNDVARALLSEPNVDLRSDLLLDSLRRQVRQAGRTEKFPPTFSSN